MLSNKRHFILNERADKSKYSYPNNPFSKEYTIPERNRLQHGKSLQRQIDQLKSEMEKAAQAYVDAGLDEDIGLTIEFESFPDIELAFERLARESQGIELLNIRKEVGS